VSTHVTDKPSAELPGSVIGKPVRIPAVLICTMGGERPCGKAWTANTYEQYLLKSAERREHEAGCQGGLIVVGSRR
jgi:hypothetical protein